MLVFMFYVIWVILIGWWAGQWNRSVGGFIALALIISPLIAGIILMIKGKNTPPSYS